MQGSPAFKFPSRDELVAFGWKLIYAICGLALTMLAQWISQTDWGPTGNAISALIAAGITNFLATITTDTRKISP